MDRRGTATVTYPHHDPVRFGRHAAPPTARHTHLAGVAEDRAPQDWPLRPDGQIPRVWPPLPPEDTAEHRRDGRSPEPGRLRRPPVVGDDPQMPPRPESGTPSGGGQPASAGDPALPGLRKQVMERLTAANENHAKQLWERRRRDPISEHALLFFFTEPPDEHYPDGLLRTAVRVLPAGDPMTLPDLLSQMAAVTADHAYAGNTPAEVIFGWQEPRSEAAAYTATGVSTVGTLAQPWAQLQREASFEMHLPGRGHAVLFDRSCVLVDRHARNGWGTADGWTSNQAGRGLPVHTDTPGQDPSRPRPRDPVSRHRLTIRTDPRLPENNEHGPDNHAVWSALWELHQAMQQVTS
jgi:hypothetical protein